MSKYSYFEHDNRGNYRVGRPMARHKKYRDHQPGPHHYGKFKFDNDGDVDMAAASVSDRRFNPYNQRQNPHRRKDKNRTVFIGGKRGDYPVHNDADGTPWFKISIPFGKKCGKNFVLKSITSLCKVPFTPFNFQFSGNSAEFYVNDYAVASQIKDVNKRITTPDGFKMVIMMCKSSPPVAVMDRETIESVKNCMSSRYDTMTKCLRLNKFHHDPGLKAQGLFVPLQKPIVLSSVVRIIKENIPELETLDLSDNRLYTLEMFTTLVPVCSQLKSLVLRDNKLRNIAELNHMKGLDLLEIVLDGNPLCDDYKDRTTYISAVRDRFPKVIRLDGEELPAPIVFDLGPETIPQSKKNFFMDESVMGMVIQFLEQYYTIYDSGDRAKLLDAYHDQANFSLSIAKQSQKPSAGGSSNNSGGSLGAYVLDNRNLLRVIEQNQRVKLLKQGKLAIVSALQELPQTMHDPSSFSVDIFHVSPGLMSFSVVGVFKEVGADINNASLKTFSRTFVVAPQGDGFGIVNEMLYISHASQDQQSKAFKQPAPTPSPSPAPPTEEKSPAEKQLLIAELSKQTAMNVDFSTKCLEENDWDYQRSLAVFLKFQGEGKIPPEAFVKIEPEAFIH